MGGGGDACAVRSVRIIDMPERFRVLVDLPNWLGDIVHTLPAVWRLCDAFGPEAVHLAVPHAYAGLGALLRCPVHPRPRSAGFAWGRTLPRGMDAALTARHSTRAKLLVAGTGARIRLASRGRGAAVLGLTPFAVDRYRHQRHDLDGALARLGVEGAGDGSLALPLGAELVHSGGCRRALLAGGAPLVALLPASHHCPAKRYPVAGFAAVARALEAEGLRTAVVVGPGEEALGLAVAEAARCGMLPTSVPLVEVAGLLASCQAAVGNDSGLTHLAAVAGCPTVALFGPTDPRRTAPVGGATVLDARGPDEGRRALRALEGLDPARVVAAVTAVMREHDAARAGEPASGLRREEKMIRMCRGGGPLAQLAEQGTLNP